MSFIRNHGIEFPMREANFESPVDFDIVNKMGDLEIVFSDLTEISQGGPKVGAYLSMAK